MVRSRRLGFVVAWLGLVCAGTRPGRCSAEAGDAGGDRPRPEQAMRRMLDAPLLFVKRHNYVGIHIYDTYYKWRPGGGIYVIENPAAPPERHRIRPLIDPTTPGTLGEGIYSEPELSWDARRVLFCFKPTANGSTSIYEIGFDGRGLRRVTDPSPGCAAYKGRGGGHHDVGPAYLPDGRIVFTSTRPNGLVPCNNTGVDVLHVMQADGSDIHAISVNNTNEFDPTVLPDGRILHGRWEYVDKTALTQQSVWTIFPDGTNETALFANNMVHPEAVLDARPVPGSVHLVVGTLTPHNSPPRGTIGVIDPQAGKDEPNAIFNFDRPANPTHDRGQSCEPWPLSKDVVLYSGRPKGAKRNAVLMVDRGGRRVVVHAEKGIDCHSPMLVKPRARPIVLPAAARRDRRSGYFLVQDVYRGLTGVKRGEVKRLRVIEETSRVTGTHGAAYNQTFMLSGVLAFSAKNFLGVVPVEPDGSAYFEVPSGRAIYLQALDEDGRLLQSMRTFFQAAPGVTRACIGCHEYKYDAPALAAPTALRRPPRRLQPESWGSGYVDYPSMIQPILDAHCVRCHGGRKGVAAGLDLSGGWTEHFNISYENLISRRETQLTAYLIAGIDCMNGTSNWSARIFPPRSHGSGCAPLADVVVGGHNGRIPRLSRKQRDLILAWIDTNGLYHGTWNYAPNGCATRGWAGTKNALIAEMKAAGCTRCHAAGGRGGRFENDWINLCRPEYSRLLRAPLANGGDGLGLGLCRDRKVDARPRLRILWRGYVHAALPLDAFRPQPVPPRDRQGEPLVSFPSTDDPHYRRMLAIVRRGREQALAAPRTDMPGAELVPGLSRQMVPVPLPDPPPSLAASVAPDGEVLLSWERSARTIGLTAELHRGPEADFAPGDETRIAVTTLHRHADVQAEPGVRHYALVLVSDGERSRPIRARVTVPPAAPPPAPAKLTASPLPGRVELAWQGAAGSRLRYHVYRAEAGTGKFRRLTPEPVAEPRYVDAEGPEGTRYAYTARAVSRRGAESEAAPAVEAAALPEVKEPLFVAAFADGVGAALHAGGTAAGRAHGKARVAEGVLDLRQGGHVTFDHRPEFDLDRPISIACWVHLQPKAQMPIPVSCGHWRKAGWFLQRFGGGWRWHVAGMDCDGGKPAPGRWTHLVGTFDGRTARLFQDGRQVAKVDGDAVRTRWAGRLHVGQYSGGPAPSFQVTGRVAGLRIYGRALPAKDIAAARGQEPAREP